MVKERPPVVKNKITTMISTITTNLLICKLHGQNYVYDHLT